jgi:Cdc6-like AAA superfamily ATPase
LPNDIYNALRQFPVQKFLFVFDEFDNIKNNNTRVHFADLIKSLSDNSTNIKVMLVGIADNVENLIGNHKSLGRCLMQIKMPRMSDSELREIIEKGYEVIGLEISKVLVNKIIKFSAGFPHYTHLLCKYSAMQSLEKKALKVDVNDLNYAISLAIENASEQLRSSYSKAIIASTKKSQWKTVLYACAKCNTDEYDSFSTNDMLIEFNRIANKNSMRENVTYNLGKLCQEERGALLEKIGTSKNIRYRFNNPMMKPYVLLNMENEFKLI